MAKPSCLPKEPLQLQLILKAKPVVTEHCKHTATLYEVTTGGLLVISPKQPPLHGNVSENSNFSAAMLEISVEI